MAILEKEVLVKCGLRTDKHYEELGYEIPRVVDKWNRLSIPKGTEILVRIEHLPIKSNVKVTKVCDEEGCVNATPNQSYTQVISRRIDGKDYCEQCSHIRVGITRKNNTPYKNSLEYFAIRNNKEYLILEFSEKNEKRPNQISRGTHDKVLWKCFICSSEYPMRVSDRTTCGHKCPYCAGQRVNHTNCLWTTHPDVARLLLSSDDGFKYSKGTNVKVNFKCPDCGSNEKKIIDNVIKQGFSCSICGDHLTYPEKFMAFVLKSLNLKYEPQKVFNFINLKMEGIKRYDFYIPHLNCVIETHGRQHYEEGFHFKGGRSYTEEVENDRLKEKLAKENGIQNYIVIDCRFSELEWIKNSIINSKLSKMFNLSTINWDNCHEYACDSLVKVTSDLWMNNNIRNASKISHIMGISKDTVIKYLKQGAKIGWCDYDPKDVQRKNGVLQGKKGTRKIVQLTLQKEYIRTWNSTTEASKELKIPQSNISQACLGNYKYAGGFKWKYENEYEIFESSN